MAKSFRPVDRDQPFLLAPDMRDWLPQGHLVWFVVSVVDELDMAAFESRARLGGVGRAGYDPRMLLTVLVYAYAMGQRSSRQIERLCHTDVAFRVACAQDVPDHTTIARFRKDHQAALTELFTQVLVLCARSGLAKLGTVAIDGTKIGANASDGALRTERWLREQVEKILTEAGETDATEEAMFGPARGDELPEELTDPVSREQRIKKALADLQAERAARAAERAKVSAEDRARAAAWVTTLTDPALPASDRRGMGRPPRSTDPVLIAQLRLDRAIANHQAVIDAWQASAAQARAQGHKPHGRAPVGMEERATVRKARAALARAKERAAAPPAPPVDPQEEDQGRLRNITDPDARSMTTRKGWVVGYNAQLAVSEDQIILVADVVQNPADNLAFLPMLTKLEQTARLLTSCGSPHAEIGTVLADAGYRSIDNVTAPGPARLIATGRGYDDARRARETPASGPPPEGVSPLEAMDHQVRTEEGRALYRKRAPMIEGVNGHLKEPLGLRRFCRRGLAAVTSELHLAATAHNLLKLHRARPATA